MDNSQPPDISDIMRREFGISKRLWNLVLLAQVGMVMMGWLVPYLSFAPSWFWGVCGLVVSIAAIALKYLADQHYECGERARRMVFRLDGIGLQPDTNELLQALVARPKKAPLEPSPLGKYFSSSRPVGPSRMLDNLYESSFYTHQIATRARNIFATVCTLGLLSAFILLRASAVASNQGGIAPTGAEYFGKIATEIVGFFAAGSFLEAALVYHQLARSAERVFERCGLLETHPTGSETEVAREVADYDCAMAKARPLPTWTYRLHRTRLDEAWRAAVQTGAPHLSVAESPDPGHRVAEPKKDP